MNENLIGQKLVFNENNLKFFQDFAFWQNIPTDIVFTITGTAHNGQNIWLEGKGYGEMVRGQRIWRKRKLW